jgi:hypothetical protein
VWSSRGYFSAIACACRSGRRRSPAPRSPLPAGPLG